MNDSIELVIFDLDGVICTTDEAHFEAWSAIARREGIPFDRATNERLRGVSRRESLEIMLERASRRYSEAEKDEMATSKNELYRASLDALRPGDTLAGIDGLLDELDARGVRLAIGSSSRNARKILDRLGLTERFAVIIDGTDIERSKPDPQVFALAGERLGVAAGACVVIEDAEAGVEAARRAGMRCIAVGPPERFPDADRVVASTADLTADIVLA